MVSSGDLLKTETMQCADGLDESRLTRVLSWVGGRMGKLPGGAGVGEKIGSFVLDVLNLGSLFHSWICEPGVQVMSGAETHTGESACDSGNHSLGFLECRA